MSKSICKIRGDGSKLWYNKKGLLHRLDGPAIEYSNGTKYWIINGNCHRENGPAIEHSDGTKEWLINDNRHREDGPAIEYVDGKKEYWYNNRLYDVNSAEELMIAVFLR